MDDGQGGAISTSVEKKEKLRIPGLKPDDTAALTSLGKGKMQSQD
jgi:hypothetical protein